jgi:predicted extracellular nuclease
MKLKFTLAFAAAFTITLTVQEADGAVIISQYYEGSSNNKWIELFNTSTTAINLATDDYRLGIWSNANREAWKSGTAPNATIDLNVSIPGNGTVLIANSSAALPSYVTATVGSGALTFNGDDSVVLYTGATFLFANVVDAIGLTGNTAADTSFVRKPSVLSGVNTDFSASEWDQFTNSQVDNASSANNEYLGTHAIPEPTAALLGSLGLLGLLRRRRGH